MILYYATEDQACDTYSLPTILVTRFTSLEFAETMQDEIYYFMKRHEFRLASMNSRVRENMLDAMVQELDIEGGFVWCVCLPGCLPDSEWTGPFATEEEAVADARECLTEGL